jgi:hypothetical protein
MGTNVFDRVARDYERIHNRSLPPGVCSDDFIRQRAATVARWLSAGDSGKEVCYLDFGCGNGRMLKSLLESNAVMSLVEQGRHVFHHIPPAERAQTAAGLATRMNPLSRLVIWEHNPFNPLGRMLVKMCPFDRDARLLTLNKTKSLFGKNSFRYREHAYVNVFPPRWLRLGVVSAIEAKLSVLPVGAQYWVSFERDE